MIFDDIEKCRSEFDWDEELKEVLITITNDEYANKEGANPQ